MTCIVGLETGTGVIIGGDRATVGGGTVRITGRPKVFRLGNIIVGSSGCGRVANILENSIELKGLEPSINSVMECVVHPLKEILRNSGNLKISDNLETTDWADFLIGIENCLFSVYSDFQVDRYECGYNAIGSGQDYALGSLHSTGFLLHSTDSLKAHKYRVELALEAAASHCSTVRPPFDMEEI